MSPRKKPTTPWPWPHDSAVDRARRVATSYRSALEQYAPMVCAKLDEVSKQFGQGWVLPHPAIYADDDLLTTELAADYLHVQPRTIDEYKRRGLPATDTVDGLRYRVGDIKRWVAQRRLNRARRAS